MSKKKLSLRVRGFNVSFIIIIWMTYHTMVSTDTNWWVMNSREHN